MLRFGFWSVCLVSPCPSCRLFSPLSPLSGRHLNVQCVTDWLMTQCGSGSRGVEGFEHQLDGDHYAALDRSERSTSPDPRGPWTHHLHAGGRCGGGGGHGWGGSGSACGGFVRVLYTQSEHVILFDVLDHRLWPPHKWAAQNLG